MRLELRATVGIVLAAFFLAAGFRPDGMPYSNSDALYSDAVLSHWPAAYFFRESVLNRNEYPVWRDTTMAGQPFAANPLNKTAYPLQWLTLVLQPALHLNLLIVLHIVIAAIGMGYWAAAIELRPEAAAFAALTYGLSPRLLGHLGGGHLDIVAAMAWFPWLMLAVRHFFRSPNLFRSGVFLALSAALILIADIRVALFAYITASFYGLMECRSNRQWRRVGFIVPIAGIVGILSAALIIPLILWSPYLSRTAITTNDPTARLLEPLAILGLVLPGHGGKETVLYVGLTVLALAILGILSLRRPTAFLCGGMFIVLGLYALGSNSFLWPFLTNLFPPLLWFRVPARIWIIAALLLPVLAAIGLQRLLARVDDAYRGYPVAPRKQFLVILVCGMISLCGGFALIALPLQPSISITALVGGLLLSLTLIISLRGLVSARTAGRLLLALTALDMLWTGSHMVQWRSPEQWLDPQRPLAERLVELGADRIYSPTFSLEQQVAEIYQLHLFGGVDPFQLQGIVQAVEAGSGVPSNGYEPVLPSLAGTDSDNDISTANRDAVINTQILATWNVSHVIAAYPIEHAELEPLGQVGTVYLYANRDYQTPETKPFPDWPVDWPDLPSAEQVIPMNNATRLSAAISALGWATALLLIGYSKIRDHQLSSGKKVRVIR